MSGKEGNSSDDGERRGRSVRASGSQSRVELAHKIGATMTNITHEDILKFPKPHKPRSDATDDVVKRIESAPDLRKGPTDDLPKIRIGVCAMDKKANSKQMRAITQRLIQFGEFDIIKFGDDTILNTPVEDWPVVQCLLSWHSGGFPLNKAQKYVNLRKPYLINDVFSQDILLDRRKVYRRLVEAGIPVPYHIIVDRDDLPEGRNDPESFVEGEDFVELDGVRINKPFVEKPASGEDHNIYIYYPHSMGGGVKKLFRKIDNKSADYDPKHPGTVRRDGSFIYEEFLTTGGTDVKVYTVGPRYAHAEARKSPVVDGKVQRTADGKEVRYPVLLSPQEKEIARSVCLAFGQRVCGFDLLRSERGRSFVCDVNGWSFVKNSQKYYDDAAGILRMTILSAVAPHRLLIAEAASARPASSLYGDDVTIAPDYMEDQGMRSMHPSESFDDVRSPAAAGEIDSHSRPGEELRCVLAVVRHGDRTPKQKMKIVVTQQPMLDLLHKYLDAKGKQAKLKSPKELQELLDVTRQLLDEMDSSTNKNDNAEADELREKFRIIKTVLEQGGQFAGINRKVQLKPLKWTEKDDERVCTEALLILKHGGVLTHAGRQQAEALGSLFRNVMYPQSGPTGGGLLRLHSTYRHDLKIYSSDEGRVQTSAAAFAKGLLDLEGSSLTPILVSLVNKDAGMLDAFGKGASVDISAAKQELYAQMTYNNETQKSEYAMPEYSKQLQTPPPSPSIDALPPDDASSTSTSGMQSSSGRNSNGNYRQLNLGEPGTFSLEDGPPPEGASNIKGRPHIYPMPADPLKSLRHLSELCKTLVDQLREKCLEEARKDESQEGYSALTMDPNDWQQQPDRPCGGEKMLLMFDRWRKLSKAFFNEKKGFDISKVPDIYDAAKYDSIHNANLGLSGLEDLYNSAKELAAAVIPNEYGLQAIGKLRIGSTICANLLGKLLADLASMRDESMTTAGLQHEDSKARSDFAADLATAMESINMDESPVGGEDDAGEDGDDATMHRLCPTYAQDVNSPLRHVRTRIYFTSESHCHSLVNVLRYCHLGLGNESIIGENGEAYLHKTSELDYMTHVVLRMFENKSLPLQDPGRFRVELLFSPGAGHNPHEVVPIRKDHVIPIVPRTAIHKGDEGGVTLHELEQATKPYAKPFKRKQDPYLPLKGTPATAHTSEKLDFWI
ncbi:hypothetical protein M9435_002885 [Picochlorum sp. BPE23]|nr:hypothetical protein M9435_002885 [Picochlorum sp. BPE23]